MIDNKDKKLTSTEDVIVDFAFEKMFKDFVKQVKKDGVLEEVKRRRYYQKPSAIKRQTKKSQRR